VCQPQLGASLRKVWFRNVGTLIGAVTIVVLTAVLPQDRHCLSVCFLPSGAASAAFAATAFRNFASYSAALAGYTAAIIAAENLGATGGASSEVFLLAVTRATKSASVNRVRRIVLAGTVSAAPSGGSPNHLQICGRRFMSRFIGCSTGRTATARRQSRSTRFVAAHRA